MRSRIAHLALCFPLVMAGCAGAREVQMTVAEPAARDRSIPDDSTRWLLLRMFAILGIASLAACGLFRAEASWSDEISDRDATSLAGTLATLVSARIEPGDKPIRLVPAANGDGKQLTSELKSLLEARGYMLADEERQPNGTHRLRYLVTAYSGGYVLRVMLGGAEASMMLSRDGDGRLVTRAPLTVREVDQ